MAGMMSLCLVLGLWGVLGSSQLSVAEGEDDVTEDGMTATYGFNTYYWTIDFTEAYDGDAEGECDEFKKAMDDDDTPKHIEMECEDDDTYVMSFSISDHCDWYEETVDDAPDGTPDDALDELKEDRDEACSTATAGTMGSMGMWVGVVCALVAALILILPMAGIDAMDSMPDIAKTIVTWAAGGMMLIGILLWWILLPDTDTDTGLGMTGWFGIIAAVLGLGAAAMDQFMPTDE